MDAKRAAELLLAAEFINDLFTLPATVFSEKHKTSGFGGDQAREAGGLLLGFAREVAGSVGGAAEKKPSPTDTVGVCLYCGKQWPPYKGKPSEQSPYENDLLKHVTACEKNPLVQELKDLNEFLCERDLFGEFDGWVIKKRHSAAEAAALTEKKPVSPVEEKSGRDKREGAGSSALTAKKAGAKNRGHGKNPYFGVTPGRTKKNGDKRWKTFVNRKGDYWWGGTFESAELAAAAVQDHLGNPAAAAMLRELHKKNVGEIVAAKAARKEIHHEGHEGREEKNHVNPVDPVKKTGRDKRDAAGSQSKSAKRRGRKNPHSDFVGVYYRGVRRDGSEKWESYVYRDDGNWKSPRTGSELLAAAARAEHLGDVKEAARLRQLDKEKRQARAIEALKGKGVEVAGYMCTGCGQNYESPPEKCGKCNGRSFEGLGMAAFIASAAE